MICFTIPDHILYTKTYHTILSLVHTILPSITENRVHEAGYFHAISRGSKLIVNLVQLSEPGQSADGMEPVLQAMNEVKSFQPDVILLYTNNKNVGLFVQQVITVHYISRFYLNTSPQQRFLQTRRTNKSIPAVLVFIIFDQDFISIYYSF